MSVATILITIALAAQGGAPIHCAAVDPVNNTVVMVFRNGKARVVTYRDQDRIYYSRPVSALAHLLVTKQSGRAGRFGCSPSHRGWTHNPRGPA